MLDYQYKFIFTLLLLFPSLSNEQVIDKELNIFVDCSYCDTDYIQTEIPYVKYVRNRQDSNIHILISEQQTGGGGWEVTLTFIGLQFFEGIDDTMTVNVQVDDSEDIIRQELVRVMKLGLVRYLMKTSEGKNLSISYIEREETVEKAIIDKWNKWVYSVNLNSFLNGQETTNSTSLWASMNGKRVTEAWKFKISLNSSYSEDNFDYYYVTYTNISRSGSINAYLIKSLTDHWSIGLWGRTYTSTYSNINYNFSLKPGIEYNVYPYSESTRHQLRIEYIVGPEYNDYLEQTIYLKDKEKLIEESLSVSLEQIQPWGSISSTLSGSHYFYDISKNKLELWGNLALNIVKGLSININGRISRIHNQLSLPRKGADLEEVFLRRKELETQYNYWGSIGLSYSFGSIFSTIVNPRFGI